MKSCFGILTKTVCVSLIFIDDYKRVNIHFKWSKTSVQNRKYLQTLECQLSKLNLVIQVSCCDRGAEIWLERSRKWFRCVDLLMTCCASDVGRLHEFLCAVFCIGRVLQWRFFGLIACISGKLVQVRMS